MPEYQIIARRNMKNILSSDEISPENVYRYMYKLDEDVLYIVEGEYLAGVISVGDLLRYYDKNVPLKLNSKFRFVESYDCGAVDQVLMEIPSIHELPVIDKTGRFTGIIKAGRKDKTEWDGLKNRIDDKRFGGKAEYLFQEFKRWLLKQQAKVVVYDELSWDVWERTMPLKKCMFKKRTEGAEKEDILPLYALRNMNQEEQKQFFGGKYYENCIQGFMENYEKIQLVSENGMYSVKDLESEYFTFKNGYRVTPNNTGEQHKIYIYGACHILGGYVSDCETIEFYLKERLIKEDYPYDVINGGLWKGNRSDMWINRMLRTNFREGDIVIIGQTFPILKQLKEDLELKDRYLLIDYYGNTYKGMTEKDIRHHFLDHPYHHDGWINDLDAQKIWSDISPLLRRKADDYYIPWETVSYYKRFFAVQGLNPSNKRAGAILMTCNPFTKGHRYLIEKAADLVELLYVFVVEEEVEGFSFKDRLEMVRLGTKDLESVEVLPLGKYIGTKETFPQYFERNNVTEIKEMDYDIHVFADTIAKELNISFRFVGDEPYDKVTKAYNETMKRILPKSNIKVMEIPRKMDERGGIISASVARRLIKDKDIERLKSFLPDTTINYLIDKRIV